MSNKTMFWGLTIFFILAIFALIFINNDVTKKATKICNERGLEPYAIKGDFMCKDPKTHQLFTVY